MNSFLASTRDISNANFKTVPHHERLTFHVGDFDVAYNFVNLDGRQLRSEYDECFVLIDGNIYNCPEGITQEEFVVRMYREKGARFYVKQLDGRKL